MSADTCHDTCVAVCWCRSTWTPLAEVGRLLLAWTQGRERFQSGSLVSLVTSGGQTRTERC